MIQRLNHATSDVQTTQFDYGHYGLVIGYVQSGKTSNYTALCAKAADYGYNLVIILSGLFNDLREQTQSRLLRELAGKEKDLRDGIMLVKKISPQMENNYTKTWIFTITISERITEYRNTSSIKPKMLPCRRLQNGLTSPKEAISNILVIDMKQIMVQLTTWKW